MSDEDRPTAEHQFDEHFGEPTWADEAEEERGAAPLPPLVGGEPVEGVRIIGGDDEPPLRFGPDDTGPLQHWTEPPTGEVPKILVDEGEDDDLEAWSGFAGRQPVWRDDRIDTFRDEEIDFSPLAEGTRLGALDERREPDDLFDDLGLSRGAPEPSATATGERARVTPIRTRGQAPGASLRRPGREQGAGFTPTRGTGGRNMPLAIGVGVGIAVVAIVLFWAGPAYTMALVVAIVVLSGIEFYEKARERGYLPATLVGLVAIGSLPLAAYWRGEPALPLVMFLALGAVAVWFVFSGSLDSNPVPNTAITMLGAAYVGFLGSYAALLLQFRDGVSILLLVTVGVVAYDIGGLFVGSAAGRTQLVPWISPNKTVEGLFGGVIAVYLGLLVCDVIGVGPYSNEMGDLLALATVVALTAPLGDLTNSMLKRNLDVKDWGTLLPGHGGALDRFCSFLFTLPAAYYLTLTLDLAGVVGI